MKEKGIPMVVVRVLLVACLLCFAVQHLPAQTQPNPAPLYYTGIVGGDAPAGRRVLLRWYTLEQFVPLESAVIFRTGNDGVRQRIVTVRRTRSAALIKSIFYRSGEQRILQDARATLERIYGTSGNSEDEFAQLCIDLLEGRDATDYASARRNFLVQINYGFAIIEGLGYVDFVDPASGPYLYELWQGDSSGTPLNALGKITLDAENPMILPPPVDLREVFLLGRDGATPARANHRRIFLNWDPSPELYEKRDLSFGYDIFKLARPLAPGETFESVQDELTTVNEFPILPPSPIPDEDAEQSYIFADDGGWLDTSDEDDLLPVGETYTYWAVARDLLGNRGLPSNPLQATVRDTFEPNTPRGMNVVPERDNNDVPLLRVFFTRQDEDTVAYRLYRFQKYENQGFIGPFPPVDGLTEGLIATLVQPADPGETRIVFDDYEPGTTTPGRVFWYCVSAVDDHGNESPMSPPARGVIDDVVPPTLDGILEICGARPLPLVSGSVRLEETGTQNTWFPLFRFEKVSPLYAEVRIYRTRPLEGEAGRPQMIARLPLSSIGTEYSTDGPDESVEGSRELPTYTFEAVAFDGSVSSIDIDPPDWNPGSARARYEISLDTRGVDDDCIGGPAANEPQQFILIPGGDVPPLRIKTACPAGGDTVGYRLYRSVNGGLTYSFVREFLCTGAPTLDLIDDYHPEGLAQVKYSVAPFDKHGNIGIPYVLPGDFVVIGNVPRPTVLEVIATGEDIPSQRAVTVKWTGPRQGISHYNVRIVRKSTNLNQIATPPLPLEFPLSDVNDPEAAGNFSYDPSNNEYSITTRDIDRSGSDFDTNAEYLVSVAAVPKAGAPAASTNQLPLIWASKKFAPGGIGELRWAARPMPESVTDSGLILSSSQSVRGGSVLIPVRTESTEFGATDHIAPPFMVWRRRTDLPGFQWHAVSPVIEQIRRTGGGVIDDPFFHKQGITVFFVDNSGHVPFRPYEYLILKLNYKTFELEQMIGPFEVEVEITPQ